MQHVAALKKKQQRHLEQGLLPGQHSLKREAIARAQRYCTSSTHRFSVVRSKGAARARHCRVFVASRYCANPKIVVHGFAARYQGINATDRRLADLLISLKQGFCMPFLKNRSSSHASRPWSRSNADAGNVDPSKWARLGLSS